MRKKTTFKNNYAKSQLSKRQMLYMRKNVQKVHFKKMCKKYFSKKNNNKICAKSAL